VEEGEEDAGEDGGEDQGRGGEVGGDLPALMSCGVFREGEPVVGDGEGGQEEAAETDLFEHGGEEGAEGGDEPDVGGGAEEVVHGDGLGDGDKGGDGLDGEADDEAHGDELEDVAAGGGEIPMDAVGEGAGPEKGKDEPGGDERDDVGDGHGQDEELGLHGGGEDFLRGVRRMGEADEGGLRCQKDEAGEGDEEKRVAEVGDAGGDAGAGGEGGWWSEDDDGFAVGLLGCERGRGIGEGRLRLGGAAGIAWERWCEGRAHFFLVGLGVGFDLAVAFLAAVFFSFGAFSVSDSLDGRLLGTPVFFSGAMNFDFSFLAASAAAAMEAGWGPAWLAPLRLARVAGS